jgi:hypothetical protein
MHLFTASASFLDDQRIFKDLAEAIGTLRIDEERAETPTVGAKVWLQNLVLIEFKNSFHAMLWVKAHIIDLMRLMRLKNRHNRPSRRYLLPKCYQLFNQWEAGQTVGN